MEKILTKTSFSGWLKKLDAYTIYAPVVREGIWSYEIVDNVESVSLEYPNTILSPKKMILPQREVFLEFQAGDNGSPAITEIVPDDGQAVVFGVRPCDGKGMTHQDRVFKSDTEDPYFIKRRNQIALVGLACNTPPHANCFCTEVDGSPHSSEGFDILMTDLGDTYLVQSLTDKGEKLVQSAKNLFSPSGPADKKKKEHLGTEAAKKLRRRIDKLNTVPPKLKDMFDSDLWDEESLSCISCGICTYLCPTCHCFDINDEVFSSSPLKGKRVRTWDNCQFPDFTMHSSGHNPRPDRAARLRQRIMHKFQYFVTKYNNYQCTGCGRCINKCPVGIDIIEVLEKVRDHGA